MKRILSLSFLFLLAVGIFIVRESRAHALINLGGVNGPSSCNHFSPDYDPLQCFYDGGGITPINSGGGNGGAGGGITNPPQVCGGRPERCHTCSGSTCAVSCTGSTSCTITGSVCKVATTSCLTGA